MALPVPSGAGARVPPNRAAPVTLEDHLSRAYAAKFRLEGSDSEDLDAVVKRLAKAGIPRAQIAAERERLSGVEARCIVSRVLREVLDQALADTTNMPG